jgi:hypothetical protein
MIYQAFGYIGANPMRVIFALLAVVYLAIPAQAEDKKPPPKPGDIRGESLDDKHKDWIELRSGAKAGGTVQPTPTVPTRKTAK